MARSVRGGVIAIGVVSACLGSLSTARAQETTAPASGSGLEKPQELQDIVVTARKREENLLSVPVAVAVMTDTKITETGVRSIRDLAQFTPGLFAQNGDSGSRVGTRLTFRGLSTSTGVSFIDGAPFAGSGTPDLTDVARVEVLKGPQSVYFGRSTFSGAVNYVTKTPGNDYGGRISADVFSYRGFEGRLSLEGPLIADLLRVRISARRYSFGGQYRNGFDQQRLGGQSTTSGTIAVASSPASNLNLSAYYAYSLDDDGQQSRANLRVTGPGVYLNCDLGGQGGPYYCGALPTGNQFDPRQIGNYAILDSFTYNELINNVRGTPVPFRTNWLDHFGLKRRIHHVHARADLEFGSGWEAALLGGYTNTQTAVLQGRENLDTSTTPNSFYLSNPAALAAACAAPAGSAANGACFRPMTRQLSVYQLNAVNDYNGEVRLSSPHAGRLRATAGLSFFGLDGPITASYGIQNNGRLVNSAGGGMVSKVSTPAVFGGVYFDLNDQLTFSAEGRYQWDSITQQQIFPATTQRLHQVFRSFSPRATVDYKIAPRSLLYATYSRGYRPGGFNPVLIGQPQSVIDQLAGYGTNITYEQEKLDNFELGHKAQWFNNRLRTTLALYYMKYQNGQVSNVNYVTLANGSFSGITITSNTGRVDLKGLELEVDLQASRDLTVSGTLGLADNKIVDYVYTPNGLRIRNSTDVNGNQLDQTPRVTATVSPNYRRELKPGLEGFLRLDYIYNSRVYVDPTNVTWRGASNLFNINTGINVERGIRLAFYVNNLFDNGVVTEAVKNSDGSQAPNPGISCPPCISPAFPPVTSTGVSVLNTISVGLPNRRTVGVRGSYQF